jgi:small-conductance mechanosensitive channel
LDIIRVVGAIAFIFIGLIAMYVINRLLAKLAVNTKTKIDDRILKATRSLDFVVILLTSAYIVLPSLEIPYSSEISINLYFILLAFVVLILARVLAILLDEALEKIGVPAKKRVITVSAVKISILALGFIGIVSQFLNVIVPFAVSLGIIGFALTFSLQYPLSNFVGWFYIMTSRIFNMGDLVRLGEHKGSILSIGYLTTKIVDMDDYGNPSGRILTIPNSTVLTSNISNWVNPPSFWDEVSFIIAYESDLKYVREIMIKIAKDVQEDQKLGSAVDGYMHLYEQIGHGGVSCEPRVVIDTVEGGWVRARLLYLTPLSTRLTIKTLITEKILEVFNANPDLVKFPIGRAR